MTATLIQEDFSTVGALPSTPWTVIAGSAFVSDGSKAKNGAFDADQMSTLQTIVVPSLPTPRKVRYELDVLMPTTLPSNPSQNVYLGVAGLKDPIGLSGLMLRLQHNSGGSSQIFSFLITATSTVNNYPVHTGALTLTAGTRYRLRLDVTFNPTTLQCVGFVLSGSGATLATFTQSIPVSLFNSITGRSITDFDNVSKLAGLFARVDGNIPGYVDRLRVFDIGASAVDFPEVFPEPTLTAAPTLTPIALADEDNSVLDILPVDPAWPSTPDEQWGGVEFRPDGGQVITRATQSRGRINRGQFFWPAVNTTDHDALMSFHASMYGRHMAWHWTDPETQTVRTLKFTSPMSSRRLGSRSGSKVFEVAVEVTELFA